MQSWQPGEPRLSLDLAEKVAPPEILNHTVILRQSQIL